MTRTPLKNTLLALLVAGLVVPLTGGASVTPALSEPTYDFTLDILADSATLRPGSLTYLDVLVVNTGDTKLRLELLSEADSRVNAWVGPRYLELAPGANATAVLHAWPDHDLPPGAYGVRVTGVPWDAPIHRTDTAELVVEEREPCCAPPPDCCSPPSPPPEQPPPDCCERPPPGCCSPPPDCCRPPPCCPPPSHRPVVAYPVRGGYALDIPLDHGRFDVELNVRGEVRDGVLHVEFVFLEEAQAPPASS